MFTHRNASKVKANVSSTTNAPASRWYHTAVWTDTEMVVWGGSHNSTDLDTGWRYNPGANTWTATSTTNGPDRRFYHAAVCTSDEMIVWGGYGGGSVYLNSGGKYCAQSGVMPTPTATPTATAPITYL